MALVERVPGKKLSMHFCPWAGFAAVYNDWVWMGSMTAREVFRRYTEAIDHGDIAAAAALVHDNFRLESAGLDGVGRPEFVAAMQAQLAAFPDYSENPSDIQECGDEVHFTALVTGTQRHALAPPGLSSVQPTGRPVHLPPERAWFSWVTTKSFAIMWSRWLVAVFAEFSAS